MHPRRPDASKSLTVGDVCFFLQVRGTPTYKDVAGEALPCDQGLSMPFPGDVPAGAWRHLCQPGSVGPVRC